MNHAAMCRMGPCGPIHIAGNPAVKTQRVSTACSHPLIQLPMASQCPLALYICHSLRGSFNFYGWRCLHSLRFCLGGCSKWQKGHATPFKHTLEAW
mmetsp:Transcript_75075/g.131181  ORF Transcript_75075/g.131181 Transcript_75075/m.131181 type:complete len:96 (+) Transcript_75075:21-308(+)